MRTEPDAARALADHATEIERLAESGFELLQKLLCEQYGYLTPLIYGFAGKADESIGSIGTDGRTVYYNTAWLLQGLADAGKLEQLKQAYLHMLAHCVLGHVWQTAQGDTLLWDEAFDFVAETFCRQVTDDRDSSYEARKLLSRLQLITPEALTALCRGPDARRLLDKLAMSLTEM